MLEEFEQGLHLHTHLENNILFPKTIEMEEALSAALNWWQAKRIVFDYDGRSNIPIHHLSSGKSINTKPWFDRPAAWRL